MEAEEVLVSGGVDFFSSLSMVAQRRSVAKEKTGGGRLDRVIIALSSSMATEISSLSDHSAQLCVPSIKIFVHVTQFCVLNKSV